MSDKKFDYNSSDIAWCPGCGNFALHRTLKQSLEELKLEPQNVVIVSGIGQAAKLPQYTKVNMFNGLHGRSLPVAMAIKASNPDLTVITHSGDGCNFGEGGNHFIHQITRNPDITVIVHDNQIYGLTKGQASPTSPVGLRTPVQVNGVTNKPFNPLAVAISLEASFVARVFVGDVEKTKQILKKAIQHKGFALVDAFCPCVSYNKLNTYKWYKENTYYLDSEHDPYDQKSAFAKAVEVGKYPLGIFYINKKKSVFWETTAAYKTNKEPLYLRKLNMTKLKNLIDSKRP